MEERMPEVKLRWVMEFQQTKVAEPKKMSLGELLYYALMGDRRVEGVAENPLRG